MIIMFSLLWTLIIGGLIGALAGAIVSRDMPMGWIGNIVGGLIGAWLGEAIFGSWGPQLAGMAILPAIVGAVILVLVVSMVTRGLAS
ncbi:hypothetical protein FC95_GL001047 [Lentilactobacillus kefiri DSM 20587 = JCM 5818]|uniref:GlsB/YeaQ/YmgE family stress response membrane protein n=2 Tax=Lentilactobacillus kefiri TaxID=33962 RepID=A0A8E1RJG3_LENKE|nr:hypothetical protein FD08_GL003676 [Lentilactobacillus parakefiri DSM 10551]KRM52853.1 hypothetical protein FC95_GL001047 [Lentilactobacillus kefiri DSM 20587 = JCM 5818]